MPEFRFIDSLNIISAEGHSGRFDNKPYAGLQIRLKALKAATAITEPTTMRVRVNFRGHDIVNAQWQNLRKWQDLLFGKPEVVDGGAGVESDYGLYIPFYHSGVPNCIHKRIGDSLDFYVDQMEIAACTLAQCEIYGVSEDLPELYVPSLQDFTETAATGENKIVVHKENIAAIMLTEPATTVQTLLQLLIDDKLKYSGNWYNLVNHTNNLARIEATALSVVLFDLAQRRQISDALNDQAVILSTGGAGAFYYLVQSLAFNSGRTDQSIDTVLSTVNKQLQDKARSAGAAVAAMQSPEVVRGETFRRIARQVSQPEVRRRIEAMRARMAGV